MRTFQRKNNKKQKKIEYDLEVTELNKRICELKDLDPTTVLRFKQLPLSRATLKGLNKAKYVEPTLVQRLTLPLALQGQDVVVAAKTGSGKTLAFIIPILETLFREKWDAQYGLAAIIITPTRELAYQIHEILKLLSRYHTFTSALIIGGKDLLVEHKYIGICNILVCTPGRLHQHITDTDNIDISTLKMLILDEADLCLSMGFADTMNQILLALPKPRQTLLFSATQTKDIKSLIKSGCSRPVFCSAHEHSKVSTPISLKQTYVICEAHRKLDFLLSFLKHHKKKKILVFMATCKQVKYVSQALAVLKVGVRVLPLHGALKQSRRMEVYDTFLGEERVVLLATDVASRGLDFAAVDWVVQVDCPEDVTTYIHRVGRTARYYGEGEALLLLTENESTAMLGRLADRGIPIEQLKVDPRKFESVWRRMEDILCKEPALLLEASRAVKAYLKNIVYMRDHAVFDVTSVDMDALARSYGLVLTPRVRFVEKKVAAAAVAAADGGGAVGGDSSYKGLKNPSIIDTTVKAEVAVTAEMFDELFVTLPALTGKLATPPEDYSRYIRSSKQDSSSKQEDPAPLQPKPNVQGLTMTSIKRVVQQQRAANKERHKQKLRDKRRELSSKRTERRLGKQEKANNIDDYGGSGSDSDGEIDEFTQAIIDELPDPDKFKTNDEDDEALQNEKKDDQDTEYNKNDAHKRKRSRSDGGDAAGGGARKRARDGNAEDLLSDEDIDYDDSTTETNIKKLSLQQQEELALKLLMGGD